MEQEQRLVLLVTANNPQSQLFIDYLHQQLDCQVSVVAPTAEWKGMEASPTVVLLDADHIDEATMQQWHVRAAEADDMSLAAFNLRDEEHAVEILSAMNLQGVFYRSDALEMICKGLTILLEGNLWMSRSLMTRMIQFFRRQQLNSYRPVCGLTHRELEIIAMLGTGASNIEIADQLFVSEHTVKSHLYNIFRKIKVHNRLQAVNWARQNLGAPPPLVGRRQRDNPASIIPPPS
ncbi:LuxR C-terminal-related transcriptional regulator [Halomonas saccharevitans]|uniref:LuxR C-terminal-related transcriptional regulator n=1 Tax=Halomonas saccharevitans TaxID=416872 RepID=A0A1I7AAS5_9GAMM|nr:LuxR C-terminal-related transcriptional regulator [Halomonas saccharevitans]MDT8879085.1 LuxR C-terminal-related transcriptional regulator [Halomonas saccharevitans]SFT72004.1 LuxR family transcriptional regulator, csgAB operon transcriptional regulatory protein [Halomonas saccharevitans]